MGVNKILMEVNSINIVLTVNNDYAPYLPIAACSIQKNYKTDIEVNKVELISYRENG